MLEAYGATEVGVTNSITSQDWLEHPSSVGRSVAPYTAVVVDEAGAELPPGQEGRLYFRDATGRGIVYEGDPERTAAAHLSPGVFTLGEIGIVDADGWVSITDRFSDMVVTGGVNVYPAEMEQVLVNHPAVADVAGIGLPHPDLGEQLIALVVPADPGAPPSVDELQAWCERPLVAVQVPPRDPPRGRPEPQRARQARQALPAAVGHLTGSRRRTIQEDPMGSTYANVTVVGAGIDEVRAALAGTGAHLAASGADVVVFSPHDEGEGLGGGVTALRLSEALDVPVVDAVVFDDDFLKLQVLRRGEIVAYAVAPPTGARSWVR